jgi:hypothetical protein
MTHRAALHPENAAGEQHGAARGMPEPQRPAQPALEQILTLQRTAGNAAVTSLLQRDAVKTPPAKASPKAPMPSAAGLKAISENAKRRFGLCELIVTNDGPDAVASVTYLLKDSVKRYGEVYTSIAATLEAAKVPPPKKDNSTTVGLVVGIALGAIAGMIGGPQAGAIVFGVAKSAAEELLELAAVQAITSSPAPAVLPLQPSGLDPVAFSLDAWDELGRLHQKILLVASVAFGLGKAMATANHVRGEVRVMEAGGKPEIPAAEIRKIGAALTRFDTQTAYLDKMLPDARAWLKRIKDYDPRPETTGYDRRKMNDNELYMLMYHDMWMFWLADQFEDTLAMALTRPALRNALSNAEIVHDRESKVDAAALIERARSYRMSARNRLDKLSRMPP